MLQGNAYLDLKQEPFSSAATQLMYNLELRGKKRLIVMDDEMDTKILELAGSLASDRTDKGLEKAANVLLYAIEKGNQNPRLLVAAAGYLLQGPHMHNPRYQKQAISLVDKALPLISEDISLMENAISCYELVLNIFPEKMNEIVSLCLKILDLNPDHVSSMITLANQRRHPAVNLSLADAIRMLEWAGEIEPDNISVGSSLIHLYLESGNYRKARDLYRKIIVGSRSNEMTGFKRSYKTASRARKKHRKYSVN